MAVARNQQRGVFVKLADQVEQQLPARLAERQIAEFVDDDEIVAQELLDETPTAAGGLFLFELVDQVGEVIEAATGLDANDRQGDRDAQMRLARAGAADKNRVAPAIKEVAGRKLTHPALIDRGAGKDERVEILEDRELGAPDAMADRARLAVRALAPIRLATSG